LFHVSDGESSERRIFREDFNAHWFSGNHVNHAGLTSLDEFGELFKDLTSSSVNRRNNFFEFDGNVASVAIQDRAVTALDLSGVVQDDDLSLEVRDFSSWIILGIRANISSSDILDRDVFNVESDVVSWNSFLDGFVVHFN